MSHNGRAPEELEFRRIAAGPFWMGTPWNRAKVEYLMKKYTVFPDWFIKEMPRRLVTLPEFEMSTTPVTFGMLRMFLVETGAEATTPLLQQGLREAADDLPAHPVGAELALAFCAWLGTKLGGAYDLPTEAEWEKACRGEDLREFPWGDDEDATRANTREAGPGHLLPVGVMPQNASPYGLLDMAGNVEELTSSVNTCYPGLPIGLVGHLDYRILRGGTCEHDMDLARCSRRHGKIPSPFTGFRVVRRSGPRPPEIPFRPTREPAEGDWLFVTIDELRASEVRLDLGEGRFATLPMEAFGEHDRAVFRRLKHCRSEIVVRIERLGEEIVCSRPSMEDFNRLLGMKDQ